MRPVASKKKKTWAVTLIAVAVAGCIAGQTVAAVSSVPAVDAAAGTYTDVAVGDGFITALDDTGNVYTVGANDLQQLGRGVNTPSDNEFGTVSFPEGATTITNVDAGTNHTVALDDEGHVYGWGANGDSQLGNGTATVTTGPVQASSYYTFSQVAAGDGFALALDSVGRLYSWGNNDSGQLGDGTNESRSRPAVVGGGFIQVAASGASGYALLYDGTLYSWGANANGQLGDGTTGDRNTPQPVPGFTWSSIAVNNESESVLGVSSNGQLYSWGANVNGELGRGQDWRLAQQRENERVASEIQRIQIADNGRRTNLINTCVANREAAWIEENTPEEPTPPLVNPSEPPAPTPSPTPTPEPEPLVPPDFTEECTDSVEASFVPTDTSGLVPATIPEPPLEPSNPTPTLVNVAGLRVTGAAVGSENAYAVTANGGLYAWGSDRAGATGLGISDQTHTQVPIRIGLGFNSVQAGNQYAVATLTSTNALYGWGMNNHGQLLSDPASVGMQASPTQIATGYTRVVAGPETVYAQQQYAWYAWGANDSGQLGAGLDTEREFTPQLMTDIFSSVAPYDGGAVVTSFVRQYGHLGQNNGQHLSGDAGSIVNDVQFPTVTRYASAAAGNNYTLAADRNGNVWGWGSNDHNLLQGESTANDAALVLLGVGATQVFAGSTMAAAVSDTAIMFWGQGTGGAVVTIAAEGVADVVFDGNQAVILFESGEVSTWNHAGNLPADGADPTSVLYPLTNNATAVAAAGGTVASLTSGNGVPASLYSTPDQTSYLSEESLNNSALTNVEFIAADSERSLTAFIDTFNNLWVLGWDTHGIFALQTGSDIPQIFTTIDEPGDLS